MSKLRILVNILLLIIGVGFLLWVTKDVLIPLVFALFISIIVYPVYKKVVKFIPSGILAILLSFIIIFLPLIVIVFLLSTQLIDIIDSLPSISQSLKLGYQKVMLMISDVIGIRNPEILSISDDMSGPLTASLNLIKDGLFSSTEFLAKFVLCFLYAFLFLYYSKAYEKYLINQFRPSLREEIHVIISSIKKTVQSYLGGVGIVILVLSFLNTVGLYFIGIKYPIFWGTLGGLLAIIPYIGTALGGILPFLYALATAEYSLQPFAVIIYYALIQQLEGNIITPKIIGDQVNINPFVAVFSAVCLGYLWGIGGVVLAIPLVSILRIIMSHIDPLKPTSLIMSTKLLERSEDFEHKYGKKKYSITSIFSLPKKDNKNSFFNRYGLILLID